MTLIKNQERPILLSIGPHHAVSNASRRELVKTDCPEEVLNWIAALTIHPMANDSIVCIDGLRADAALLLAWVHKVAPALKVIMTFPELSSMKHVFIPQVEPDVELVARKDVAV